MKQLETLFLNIYLKHENMKVENANKSVASQ